LQVFKEENCNSCNTCSVLCKESWLYLFVW